MTSYRTEFSDFPADAMPDRSVWPVGFVDISWRQDACPSIGSEDGLRIFIDYPDPAQREIADGQRFILSLNDDDDGELASSDEWAAIVAAVDAHRFLSRPITSLDDAKAWIAELSRRGMGFHLEDDPAEIISTMTGQRTFTDAQVPLVRDRVKELYGFDCDPIALLLDVETPGWRSN